MSTVVVWSCVLPVSGARCVRMHVGTTVELKWSAGSSVTMIPRVRYCSLKCMGSSLGTVN